LAHPDQRVRVAAQFALAAHGAKAIEALSQRAKSTTSPSPAAKLAPELEAHHQAIARLHAIWGLGQIAAKHPEALEAVPALLTDSDTEVRAQAAKILGDHRTKSATVAL